MHQAVNLEVDLAKQGGHLGRTGGDRNLHLVLLNDRGGFLPGRLPEIAAASPGDPHACPAWGGITRDDQAGGGLVVRVLPLDCRERVVANHVAGEGSQPV